MKQIPDPALIDSMAMRYKHDFALLSEEEKAGIRVVMSQLWEEVAGQGFYQYPNDYTVLGSVPEDQAALWARYILNVSKHELSKLSVRDAFMLGAWFAYSAFRYRTVRRDQPGD